MSHDMTQTQDRLVRSSAKISRFLVVLSAAIGGIVVAVFVFSLLQLPVTRGREPVRLNQCRNNLKQIGNALEKYHSKYNEYPPSFTVDAGGNPLHSWRTLLLPYLEHEALYDSIDLSLPWDHPGNSAAAQAMVPVYICPSSATPGKQTTYVAIVRANNGSQTVGSQALSTASDRLQDPLKIIELPPDCAVPWMSPQDISERQLLELTSPLSWAHVSSTNALTNDGYLKKLPTESFSASIRKFVTIKDPEK